MSGFIWGNYAESSKQILLNHITCLPRQVSVIVWRLGNNCVAGRLSENGSRIHVDRVAVFLATRQYNAVNVGLEEYQPNRKYSPPSLKKGGEQSEGSWGIYLKNIP